MEYSPPPLFKQGASARAKVAFFALISVGLLMADSRLHALTRIRQAVGVVLYPLQALALMPRDAAYSVSDYFTSVSSLQKENGKLKREQILNAQGLQRSQQLLAENERLRKLLGTTAQVPVKSVLSEILYDARDAFTRKIILNRGTRDGVAPGQPVIDDAGVIGQVTRVFPMTSEVTLLTDKDQAIPVQVIRSGLRSVAYGRGQSGVLDLRFMAANADIRKGDVLVTSGIDGVYPPGLAVATVIQVENKSTDAFARIVCQPTAGIDRNRQLLILLTETSIPPRPEDEAERKERARKRGGKEVAAETALKSVQPAAPATATAPSPVPAGAANAPSAAPAPAPAAPVNNAPTPVPAPAPAPAAKTPAAPAVTEKSKAPDAPAKPAVQAPVVRPAPAVPAVQAPVVRPAPAVPAVAPEAARAAPAKGAAQ